jgi:S-DNA-T family DNA segregation ATPase FtsK/SpoIIIE
MPDGELTPYDPDEVEPSVIEGEIVGESPSSPVRQAAAVVRVVVQHEHARTAGRNVAYVGIGAGVVAKRLWEGRTAARYERWIRSAEQSGDLESALEWEKRLATFRKDRHERRKDLIELPLHVFMALPKIAAGALGILVTIGVLLAIATQRVAEVVVPIKVVASVAEIIAIVISVAWGPLVLAAPWLAVITLWYVGRGYANGGATGWSRAGKNDDDAGIVVTADTIVLALQHLGKISALQKAFKDGWRPVFDQVPVKDGRGYSAVFRLPLGVTAEMIADQRPVFARNLHRAEVEVWPSDGEKGGLGPAGSVAVWIADPGVLSKPAPEYPLLHEGTADVFAGVPGGVVPRGDETAIPVVGNNFVVGGQMGQGKSNACRVVMLGCALDPLAELDVFVFANNGDFDAYRPRLSRYHKGVEDDTVIAALSRLHELYAEVSRREARLADLGAKKVTRGLAQAHRDMRPIVSLFSECHELFGHPEYGAEAADLATKTAKRARKTAVTLLFDTQSSRKEAIPPKLVELVSVNGCFYVKTWRSNDGFLGDGAFAAGIRATELRPGRDRGTSLITGVSENQFDLLRWYFVEVNDDTGYDAAAEVIARAVAKVAAGTPIGAESAEPAIEARDLLADLDEVLGRERVRLADVPALLRDLAPTWGAYRTLTGAQLRDELDDAGVRTTNAGNVLRLNPADLRRVLAERSELGGHHQSHTFPGAVRIAAPNVPQGPN